ncbi:MAG: hypothetical protein MJE77_42765 [Proteobacteria bacterium]|nr:hypothetical protein [Pseudomonadota bacterium]
MPGTAMRVRDWLALLSVLAVAGCTASETDGATQALFDLPRAGASSESGFYALPFPNDVRLADRTLGTIDLSDYPRPNALLEIYIDSIQGHLRGFSVSAASHVRFSDPIDPRSLPESPDDSLAGEASVYMVNVDGESPRFGERIPLLFRFEERHGEAIGRNWLAALPYPGFVLAEKTTYALVVTRRLRARDGSAISAAPDMLAVLDELPSDDPAVAGARDVYAPLLSWLDEPGGDGRSDVISASVFTTQDATSLAGQLRQVIHEGQPRQPRDITLVSNFDTHRWYDGQFDNANFQRGSPPHRRVEDGGDIEIDAATGKPIVQRIEDLRFSFTVPEGPIPPAGWPVVLYSHGTGGDYHSFQRSGVAARLAEQGLAVMSTDQVMHEPRIPAGSSPELLFFNFLNPLAARDNTLQGAADLFQMVRLVRNFGNRTAPDGTAIQFDPDRVYFFGHSQGGLTGPPFLAHEPHVRGAVLSGAGGLLYLSMTLKTEPFDIAGLVSTIIRDDPVDEFNPVLAMLQAFVDRADPVVYGPYFVREPYPGIAPKHIFQSEGFTDRFTPLRSIEALATSIGADLVQPVVAGVAGLELRGQSTVQAPVSANRGEVTAVLTQYQQLEDSDGHFVVFDVPAAQSQSSHFLGSLARTGVAELIAP